MTSSMEQLYQQVILDHARAPHGRGLVPAPADAVAGESHQVNPTCGDEVTLRVALRPAADRTAPHLVDAVTWEGQGCSISQASVSVLTDLVTGADLRTVDELSETFRLLMHARGAGLDDEQEDTLGDATAFTGVAKYPARIKCALLGWAALKDAIAKSGVAIPITTATTTAKEQA
jgi:nitrogen fixation NifU-like protein